MGHAEPSAVEAVTAGNSAGASRLLDHHAWQVIVNAESARCRRYGRVSTLVLVEVVQLGPARHDPASSELSATVATSLDRVSRTSDVVGSLGHGRFGVLLSETDEIAAINFVERAREVCDHLLHDAARGSRVAIGWAEISASRDGSAALDHAFGRLLGELEPGRDAEMPGPVAGSAPEDPETATVDDGELLDIAVVRGRIETLPAARRHDPYWDLEGRAVRQRRRARRAVRGLVSLLAALILGLVLARLAATDATAILVGPNRHLVFVASTADAVACSLVFAHQVRRRRGYAALTRGLPT